MRVDQPRQQCLLAKVDNFFSCVAAGNFRKFSDIENTIAGDHDRAVLNRRTVHRHDGARADDHFSPVAVPKAFGIASLSWLSPFTTFRHSATSRLHGSWQSNGIAVAGVADPGPSRTVVWSCNGSNFAGGNFVDAIVLC